MAARQVLSAITLALMLFIPSGGSIVSVIPAYGQPQSDVFEEVWRNVKDRFFDPEFNGLDWQVTRKAYEVRAANAQTQAERAGIINRMLAELNSSHTRLYTPEEPAYHQLLGIFLPGNQQLRHDLETRHRDAGAQYDGIGIFTEKIAGKVFVSAVLDDSPAAKAGLLAGDRLIEADGRPFHPKHSFAGRAGVHVSLLIQRSPDPDDRRQIAVVPARLDGATMFLDAMKASVHISGRTGRQVGYVRLWSYAGEQYQKALEQLLTFGRLRRADALVLDLREGWGGASPLYLNLFTSRTLSVTSTGRDKTPFTFRSGWNKPVVLLVNGHTRSGKELLAYGFKKHGIGPVVGATTAGAVLAGHLSVMGDGSLLYLAVRDVLVDDGKRLEGVGVEPDIKVPFSLPYAKGSDPQRDRAVEVAKGLIR